MICATLPNFSEGMSRRRYLLLTNERQCNLFYSNVRMGQPRLIYHITPSLAAAFNFWRRLHGQELFMPVQQRGEAVIQLPDVSTFLNISLGNGNGEIP